ncbi:hydroxymethylbilane synthase [Actinotalea fermentans]|uniref:Porphobilinogen deaminase n=1 Tax=Actinotalea fermentans TaxID=43671 RepID=A0A511Z2A1_9CELL|nr:hydroxymethylbilane synthase [Actinotalea fermentans]GEN81575.1 porphobilinogen deaminase 1 [Actinotalea fermentans]
MTGTPPLRLGTRGSALALAQSQMVADAVERALGRPVELVRVRTEGDRLTGSLATLGGTGVFVAALREALADGRCDLAVHSLKDLPTADAPGLLVAAIPERADPRDALCARDGRTLGGLPDGARVGTGSPRRAAQLRALRPDLDVVDIRGNVDTRLARVPGLGSPGGQAAPERHAPPRGDLDAVVLAAAGLARLGRSGVASELLDPTAVMPAPGQGALAVECRAADTALVAGLAALDHLPSRLAVTAERALLAALEAGCAAPVGALGTLRPDGVLVLDAVVCRPDGGARLARTAALPVAGLGHDAVAAAAALGTRLAADLLAAGAADLAPLGPAPTPADGTPA